MTIEFAEQISKSEMRLLDDLLDFLRSINTSTRLLHEILISWFEGNVDSIEAKLKELMEKETEGNELKHHILTTLSTQDLNLRRGDFMRLVFSIASILDEIGGTGYRIKLLSTWKCDKKIKDMLTVISEKLINAAKTLKEIIFQLAKNTEEAIKKVSIIGELEKEIDKARRELMEYAYSLDLDFKVILKLRDLINHFENIADDCEVAGDLCRIIAVARRGTV